MEHEKREGGAEEDDGQVTLPSRVVGNVCSALLTSLWKTENGLLDAALSKVFTRVVVNFKCGLLSNVV